MGRDHSPRFTARLAQGDADFATALALRRKAFGAGDRVDRHDLTSHHVLVEDITSRRPVGTFRFRTYRAAGRVEDGYAAQFYDLGRLRGYGGRLMEIGRFCFVPTCREPDAIRAALGMVAAVVERQRIGLIFGCTSFPGVEPAVHARGFALLGAQHAAPEEWRPGRRSGEVVIFAAGCAGDAREGRSDLPMILRSYLRLGAWVGDHAVIDRDLGTMHVFTGLEVADIPPWRAERFRSLARAGGLGPLDKPVLPSSTSDRRSSPSRSGTLTMAGGRHT